jgi:GNAT superfamily N-acetyltransferase
MAEAPVQNQKARVSWELKWEGRVQARRMIPGGHACGLAIKIERAHRDVWEYFRQYHYKHKPDGSQDRRKNTVVGAHCYVATLPADKHEVVGFVAVRPAWTRMLQWQGCHQHTAYRESRLVVLPEYQGCGIGSAIGDAVAEAYVASGCRYTSSFLHPALYKYRSASPLWREQAWSGKAQKSQPCPKEKERWRVAKYAFRFVGEGYVDRIHKVAVPAQDRAVHARGGGSSNRRTDVPGKCEGSVMDLTLSDDEIESSTDGEGEALLHEAEAAASRHTRPWPNSDLPEGGAFPLHCAPPPACDDCPADGGCHSLSSVGKEAQDQGSDTEEVAVLFQGGQASRSPAAPLASGVASAPPHADVVSMLSGAARPNELPKALSFLMLSADDDNDEVAL